MALPNIPLTWGSGIGNALSSGAQARYYSTKADTEQADEQRKREALPSLDAAMKGDPTAMGKLAYGDPKAAVAISTALQRMDANQRAKIKEQAEYSTNASNAILQANPAERPAIYRELHAEGIRRGYDMSRMPPEYTPQVDPMLRTYRQMGIDLNKQLDRDVRLQIHNTPGGGGGGELAPIMTPGAAPTPTPQPAAPSRPMSSVVPPGAPPTNVAQAPQDNEGTFLSADPSIKAQPQRSGPMFYEDPTPYGYVMAQDRRKPGQPVIDEHGIRYINPQTKEVVIFKPAGTKPHGPEGPFAGNAIDAQAYNLVLKGNPSSPEYAAAYAHLAAPKLQFDEATGKAVQIKPDMSWAQPPTRGKAGTKDIDVVDVPGLKRTPEAFKKLDTEVQAVNAAIDNFRKVIGEAGGGSFSAFINNPQSPEAQKVLGAFNAMKTALRSEAFVNTGVLQPAEMTMLDNMLLAPTTVRGLMATPDAYGAMLDQIKQFVGTKAQAARTAYGVDGSQPKASEQPADPLEGQTATNPKTKEKVIRRGGQWVPVK